MKLKRILSRLFPDGKKRSQPRVHNRTTVKETTLTAFSIVVIAAFALWWFRPESLPHNFIGIYHAIDILLFFIVSYVIWHPIIMEMLTWSISSHIKNPTPKVPQPGLKVAFITTIVPSSESLDLLHRTLPAMVHAEYPHDTWLLDEGDSEEVKAICKKYGVKHFSRVGKRRYNLLKGKFAKKTKGGNHNSWYDTYGNTYDIVAQIDTDFVPKANFLTKTLGYFNDPHVAFVGTPQIYGNTQKSIIARGAAEQQYNFYGTILRGLSGMESSLLIGANHIIRVAALKDVDHYSAHITEDLLTGMKLHNQGWKSVYLSQAYAIGEGPETWQAYFNQQMRWAYGCMDILFTHSFRLFKEMGVRRAIYYFFLQQHYFSGIAMALSVFLVGLYFFTGLTAATISFFSFFSFYIAVLVLCFLMSLMLQRYHVDPERESGMLTAGKIISVAAWPIYFLAFLSVLRRKRLTYKVTPKGTAHGIQTDSLQLFGIHFIFGIVSLLSLISAFITHRHDIVMVFWAVCTTLLMFSIPFVEKIIAVGNTLRSHLYSFYKTYDKLTITYIDVLRGSGVKGGKSIYQSTILATEGIIADILFLSAILIVSAVHYIQDLGFYSDDWSFLGNFIAAKTHSLIRLVLVATSPNTEMRPVQNFLDALLFWLFGTQPLGYHVVNLAVLILMTIMFYLILRYIKIARIVALSITLVYALLPHYSTDRFWYAAFQANVSMLFYFTSVYAGLKGVTLSTRNPNRWKVLSLVTLFLSTLSYEVALPLYIINMVLFWRPFARLQNGTSKKPVVRKDTAPFIVLTSIALFYSLVFKTATTIRLGGPSLPQYPGYLSKLFFTSFSLNFFTWVGQLPSIVMQSIAVAQDHRMVITSIILGFCIASYLITTAWRSLTTFPHTRWFFIASLFSLVIFYLGYAIFATNANIGFSLTGMENRVVIAAAIGVSLGVVAFIGWITRLLFPERIAKVLFSITIGILCGANFLVINTIASFWSQAYAQNQQVVTQLKNDSPQFMSHSTILIDGTCSYVGPAPILESYWDVKGVLMLAYNDPTITGDIIRPGITVGEKGISTKIYSFDSTYSYHHLYVYNTKEHQFTQLRNEKDAQEYLTHKSPNYNGACPPSSAGNGVTIFH